MKVHVVVQIDSGVITDLRVYDNTKDALIHKAELIADRKGVEVPPKDPASILEFIGDNDESGVDHEVFVYTRVVNP